MKKKHIIMALLCLLGFGIHAQANLKPVPTNIQQLKSNNATFVKTSVFTNNVRDIKGNEALEREISDGALLSLDLEAIDKALDQKPTNMLLTIPDGEAGAIEMELYASDITSNGFVVTGSQSGTIRHSSFGLHYHGIIKGDVQSLVAISIFKDEIHGVIADERGNRVIGKVQGRNEENTHILYHVSDMLLDRGELCAGTLPTHSTPPPSSSQLNSDVGDCVKIYFEADHDIFLNKNSSTTEVSNYVTGFFNEVAVLYANESLEIGLSEIFIHETPSNFTGPGAGDYLDQFINLTPNFNGNLGHYINLKNLGGVAWLGVLCNSTFNRAYSGIGSTYANVPDYSWTINVVAHELGHNFGSNHTQACVWNGNSTAIDGCVDSEGGCANGPNPTNGGTIMSYCHITSFGVNFNLGFGDQPGDVMRSNVANANCLSPTCSNVPSCDDNILNGNETGVDCGGDCPECPNCNDGVLNNEETGIDCGGPNCAACQCTDLEMTLTIVFDNYPEETSWTVTDANGTLFAITSYTNAQPDGSTLTETICLPAGCYDFTLRDTYGDGICCGFGQGSYELADNNGTVVASGGEFENEETTNFCLTSSGCTPNFILSGVEFGNKLYQASNYVSSGATISTVNGNPSDITYEAGSFIDLTPGFYLLPDNLFLAHIVPCNTMPSDGTNSLQGEIILEEEDFIELRFIIPQNGDVKMTYFDKMGKVLIETNSAMVSGSKTIMVQKKYLPKGQITLKIDAGKETKNLTWIN